MPHLIKPNKEYEQAYLEGLDSLIKHDMYPDISEEIAKLTAYGSGLDKQGSKTDITRSNFWLVDGDKWLGMITIRHTPTTNKDFPQELVNHISYDVKPEEQGKGYGKEILRLGLIEAKKLGMKEVFVACNADNLRSMRVIESNGGILTHDIYVPMIKQNVKKYVINLD